MESDEFQLAELRMYHGPVACVKVLVVDANSTCRAIVSKMLLSRGYEVLTATLASDALSIIEEKKNELNLVLVEAHLPDMEICVLTEKIKKISCLPSFIMTASDYNHPSISRALCKGAKLCFRKPVQMSDLQGLWRFATWNRNEIVISAEIPGFEWHQPKVITIKEGLECQPSMNTSKPSLEIAKSKETELRDKEKALKIFLKMRKRTWNDCLHNKFMEAVDTAGINAPAKKILLQMNVPGLTKGRVANYLKKYRQYMRELDDEPQQDVDSCVSLTANDGGKRPPLSEQQGASVTNNPAFDQKVSMQLLSPAQFPFPESSNGQKSCFKQDQLELPLKQQVVAHPISSLCEFNNGDGNAFSFGGKGIDEDPFLSGVYSTAGQQSHFPIPLAHDTWNWQQSSPRFPILLLPAHENEDDILGARNNDEIFYAKGNQLFTDEDLKMWLSTIPDTLNNVVAGTCGKLTREQGYNLYLINIFS